MDVLSVLHLIGYTDLRDVGKSWRTRPIYRNSGNSTSLCIDKHTGQWYDFGDHRGGKLSQLVQLTLNLATHKEAEDFVGDNGTVSTPKNRYELSTIRKFDKILISKLCRDHSYWVGRGISEKVISIFEGGTTNNGRMANRYVFPIFDEKENVVGFSGRLLINNPDLPKWKHLGAKSNWLYPLRWNSHCIIERREIIIVESIGDMLALWENNLCNVLVTFGLDISSRSIEYMLKNDLQRIIIAFNNDEGNDLVGNKAAEDAATKLSNFFDRDQILIAIPEQKDFGEMSGEQIQAWKTTNQIKS